ncbi:hypothetical protein D7319_07170 [Streptomyces radicis]|uniref:Septum formation-related domain-containing protein n=1 Tax=Streptomyces radicis TaxID=1750517 RepID=A0A3A9WCU9_9ACTN|nr:hypothetical protein D7319_07170 [Streptomyces radicis]RKN25181.1 hypothetical protein D7318_08025 [Streptomyces radicis]
MRVRMRMASRRLVTFAALALLVLPAADAAPGRAPTDKDDTFLTAEMGGVFDLEAGECFTDPAHSAVLGQVTVLYTPCEDGADNQVYGFVTAPDGTFDRARLAAFAWETCERGFTTYWPGEAARDLDFYPVLPTAATWAFGDQDVMCVAYRPTGEFTESLLPLR